VNREGYCVYHKINLGAERAEDVQRGVGSLEGAEVEGRKKSKESHTVCMRTIEVEKWKRRESSFYFF
jgi:hypothetical protein